MSATMTLVITEKAQERRKPELSEKGPSQFPQEFRVGYWVRKVGIPISEDIGEETDDVRLLLDSA